MIRLIRQEIADWSTAFCFALPGKLGQSIRLIWGRLCLGGMGKASRLARNCRFEAPRNIRIGDANSMGEGCCFFANGGEIRLGQDVRLNSNVHLNASVGGTLLIGDHVLIGPNVVMRTSGHNFDDPDTLINQQGHQTGDITIGRDVWIAANVTILPGVTIGDGAVIAAGTVVSRDIAANAVAGGVPARQMRLRGEADN